MLNHQIARLRLLGIVFCLAGGAAITAGWAGTAGLACVDCQVPYLLSGGAAGIALTVVGVGLLIVAQLRFEGNRIAERIAAELAVPTDATTAADATTATTGAAPARPEDTVPIGLAGAFPASQGSAPGPAHPPR